MVVVVVAAAWFGFDLGAERRFADEQAYYSQSYYAALFASGRRDDPAWLDYPAFDLPPFPKYAIAAALALGGYPTPGPAQAHAWYGNSSLKYDPPGALALARVPSVLLGVLGCVAVYGLGVLVSGRATGCVAGLFLTFNPLYRMHARRAMSDVPSEAFVLTALFLGLLAWRSALGGRSRAATCLWGSACGFAAGLAVSSKMSGLLALIVLVAWWVLALVLRPGTTRLAVLGLSLGLTLAVASLTVLALNPFLTASPKYGLSPAGEELARSPVLTRWRRMTDLRVKVAADQQQLFPHNALYTPFEKAAVVAVQGFGRFGPFGPSHSDSKKRFDPSQDRWAWIWLPWVVAGAVWAAARGWSQWSSREPPSGWAVLVQFVVVLAVVTAYLPMAWDRYQLALQAPAALLASGLAVAMLRRAGAAIARRPWRRGG